MRLFVFLSSFIILGSCTSTPDNSTAEYEFPAGGYDYPAKDKLIDTNDYVYPLKDILSKRDSFNFSYYEKYWYVAYNEPNLSIKAQPEDIFRLTFKEAFGDAAIITIKKNKIIAKQWVAGDAYPTYDSTKLAPIERNFYKILYWNFPLEEKINQGRKSLDTLTKECPQLLDPFYYRQLLDKCIVPNKDRLIFTTRERAISKKQCRKIIGQISSIGYWTMPYETNCDDYSISDGYGVTLEANTKNKYNIVYRFRCPTDKIEFLKICQEILNKAPLKRSIKLLPDK